MTVRIRATLLILWGWTALWSLLSGRLDLLLRSVFHGLVGAAGIALLTIGALMLVRREHGREKLSKRAAISAFAASLVLLLPPVPSFSDLAANRPEAMPEATQLAFVLPPEQRTLTEWVRLLRNQIDPKLVDGNPVNISGFVWHQNSGPPLLARLTVRCCLADATPSGLAVAWPDGEVPQPDQWLTIRGTMAVEQRDGEAIAVVVPKTIRSIPRPRRPLEP